MNNATTQVLPKPPNLVRSLLAGFDAIGNHVTLILFPVCLDLLLWLGPRLSLNRLINSFLDTYASVPGMDELLETNRTLMLSVFERFNLLSALRTFPVGVPSLMAGSSALDNPAGQAVVWQLPSLFSIFITWPILAIIGLMVGTLFFSAVAQSVYAKTLNLRQLLKDWPWQFRQVLLLAIFWLAVMIVLIIPLSCVLPFFLMAGAGAAQIIVLIFGGLLLWLLLPLAYSPIGIFASRFPMWVSVMHSLRLTRATLPYTALFFLAIVVLSQGLDMLWNTPAESSWLTLIGVLGHGFISASLLAACYAFYSDSIRWLQEKTHPA